MDLQIFEFLKMTREQTKTGTKPYLDVISLFLGLWLRRYPSNPHSHHPPTDN